MAKVLIIKVGYSETLDPGISAVTSYGDVLRSTVLLHLFKNDEVTWLVDKHAFPILKGTPYISRILLFDLMSILQLQAEYFDTLINLEKVPGLCALADSIKAWRRYGFRFDDRKGIAEAYDGTHKALNICSNHEEKRTHNRFWQEVLYEMVNAKWDGEEYILGYEPKSKIEYDVGFNYEVGSKWPTKTWPMENWKRLEELLKGKYSISWQEGKDCIEDYFDWINSCRVIISNDSFGLHVALALNKIVIGLFGSTNPKEICFYEKGIGLIPQTRCDQFACYSSICTNGRSCIENLAPEEVFSALEKLVEENYLPLRHRDTKE